VRFLTLIHKLRYLVGKNIPVDKPRQRLLTAERCKNLRIDLRPDVDGAPGCRLLCGEGSLDQDQNRTGSGQCRACTMARSEMESSESPGAIIILIIAIAVRWAEKCK